MLHNYLQMLSWPLKMYILASPDMSWADITCQSPFCEKDVGFSLGFHHVGLLLGLSLMPDPMVLSCCRDSHVGGFSCAAFTSVINLTVKMAN